MSARFDAVVVGAAGIDTNVYLYGDDVDWTVEANFAQVTDGLGQTGCYSARALRALGHRTALVAALGADPLGTFTREALAAEDIHLHELSDPGGTHRSVNVMYRDGGRKNFFDAKRAADVTFEEPAVAGVLAGAKVVHIHLDDWCRRVLPLARDTGAAVSVDLQDVVDPDDAYRDDFVRAADLLFFSAVNHPEPEPVGRHFLRRGRARAVVVGMGAHGCLVIERDRPAVQLPAAEHAEPVVDTNGAGDALAVGFLHAHVMLDLDPTRAARYGQAAARVVCTRRGDAKRFPSAGELDALAS